MANLEYTLLNLKTEIADFLGYRRTAASWGTNRTAEVLRFAQDGYARFLMGLRPGTTETYTWSFLTPQATLVVYADVAVAAAVTVTGVHAAGTTTVTATGGTPFYATMIGRSIVITSTGTYTITGYTSSTVISVSGDATCTAKTFSIDSDSLFALPSDYDSLLDDFSYSPDDFSQKLVSRSIGWIRDWRAGVSVSVGYPTYYGIQARTFAAGTGQRYEVLLDNKPSAEYTLYYRYRVAPVNPTADADLLLGGPLHSQTILAFGLAVAEERKFEGRTFWQDKSRELMAASISLDARNQPKNLGLNADSADELIPYRRIVTVTYS